MRLFSLPLQKYASLVIIVGGVFLALRMYLGAIVGAALPFFLAWAMAYAARPIVLRLAHYTRLPRRFLSVAVVFLFVGLLLLGLFFGLRAAALELLAFGERLTAEGGLSGMEEWLSSLWEGLLIRFPFLSSIGGGDGALMPLLSDWLSRAGGALGEYALRAAGALVSALPMWFIFVLVTLVAAFYFAYELDGIQKALLGMLPGPWEARVKKLKNSVVFTMFGYLRAYFLLMLITFAMMAVGFLTLGVRYALLLAALFALLDFLPIIGVGVLLLPWAAVLLIGGNYYVGIGLLILFAAISLARQFLEPKIVGHHLGLHPLLALGATYVGLRLFGFVGMLGLPVALLVVKNAYAGEKGESLKRSGAR